jgi:nitric oxide reductase NorQ protein
MDLKVIKTNQDADFFYLPQDNEIQIFEHAFNHQLPILIKGPTGCGKTQFISFMANKLSLPLFTVACHDDLTASDLVGRHLLEGGKTYWQDGPLTKAVRAGGICYLDEIVEARKDTTVILHPLSDDRRILPIDRTGELLHAPKDFMLVVSYNPGYQNLLKGMKPSTKQRFISLRFDYPNEDIEIDIVCKQANIDKQMATRLVEMAQMLRQLKDHDLEEAVSTRLLIYAAKLIQSGLDITSAVKSAMLEPLSDDKNTIDALYEVIALKL